MKSNSDVRPDVLCDLGDGHWHFNFNIQESTSSMDNDKIGYDYDTVLIAGQPTYQKVVESLIRERYSDSEEFAIMRQRDSKVDEFAAYYEYCEQCKYLAKSWI